MTCVCKEYEGKIKMTTVKNEVFIGLRHEHCYLVGEMNLGWGE